LRGIETQSAFIAVCDHACAGEKIMLYVVRGFDKNFERELSLAFEFRHRAFVEEAGWENLRRDDGKEIDQFDVDETIHIILINNGEVEAYSRLNPTVDPHILSEVYPHLAAVGVPRAPEVWEWSRMGTAKNARRDGHGWNSPIGLLVRAVTYVALQNGIQFLTWQAHPVWVTRAGELGFYPEPLGLPQRVAGERIIAIKMQVDPLVFDTMDALGVPRVAVHEGCGGDMMHHILPLSDLPTVLRTAGTIGIAPLN
jgi:acyl-homoserine lactone synthase